MKFLRVCDGAARIRTPDLAAPSRESYQARPLPLVSCVSKEVFLSVEEGLIFFCYSVCCMKRGGWGHEYGDNPREYEEYELSDEERASLERIAARLKQGYVDEQAVREHINYLEDLSKKLTDIISSEESIGYTNVTLKHDFSKVQRLLMRLEEELAKLDPQDF